MRFGRPKYAQLMHNTDLNIPPLWWVMVLMKAFCLQDSSFKFYVSHGSYHMYCKELNCMFGLVLMHHAWVTFLESCIWSTYTVCRNTFNSQIIWNILPVDEVKSLVVGLSLVIEGTWRWLHYVLTYSNAVVLYTFLLSLCETEHFKQCYNWLICNALPHMCTEKYSMYLTLSYCIKNVTCCLKTWLVD